MSCLNKLGSVLILHAGELAFCSQIPAEMPVARLSSGPLHPSNQIMSSSLFDPWNFCLVELDFCAFMMVFNVFLCITCLGSLVCLCVPTHCWEFLVHCLRRLLI